MSDIKIRKSERSLGVERTIAAPRDIVWRCWTEPTLLKRWFCPAPWTVIEAELDVRAGGCFNCIMAGPEGQRIETVGSYLEVIPGERLVFTDAYAEGFIPQPEPFMTGVAEFSDTETDETRMVWTARHVSRDDVARHLEMGFEQGWPAAAQQLDALARGIAS